MKANVYRGFALASVMGVFGWLAGCDDGGGGASGSSAITGNVVSAQTAGANIRVAPASRASLLAVTFQRLSDLIVPSAAAARPMTQTMGGPGGIEVSLDGPDSRSTTTADDGTFSFTDLPAGAYEMSFTFDGQTVRYRGNSGQVATITIGTNQTAEVLNIRISGGKVNIGNVRVMNN
jgi:hypothetical protein